MEHEERYTVEIPYDEGLTLGLCLETRVSRRKRILVCPGSPALTLSRTIESHLKNLASIGVHNCNIIKQQSRNNLPACFIRGIIDTSCRSPMSINRYIIYAALFNCIRGMDEIMQIDVMFHGKTHIVIPQNASDCSTVFGNELNYPLRIIFLRVKSIILPELNAVKLNKSECSGSSAQEVICVDDSDSEGEQNKSKRSKVCVDVSIPALPGIAPEILLMENEVHFFPNAPPDPINYFTHDDFVLTPIGPGQVQSWRVERSCHNSFQHLTNPFLTYIIKYPFGRGYIHQNNVTPISNKTILTYRGVTINLVDQCRLWPETYLNDSIINFYTKYLQHDTLFPTLANNDFYIFPTYFYTRLSSFDANKNTIQYRNKMYQDLKGWTKNINIFSKKLLCMPINYDLHWTLIIVCNPGNIQAPPIQNGSTRIVSSDNFKTSIQTHLGMTNHYPVIHTASRVDIPPYILHFDSAKDLRLHRSQTIFKNIRKYLNACWEAQYPTQQQQQHPNENLFNAKSMEGIPAKIPQQHNLKDCGVYLLKILETVLKNPNQIVAAAKEDEILEKRLFSQSKINGERVRLLALIYDLANGAA